MKPIESLPFCSLIVLNFEATKSSASSQVASTNSPFLRMRGVVMRSSLLTKSQPNLPFTQVEMALAGASETGWIFRISRSLVQISNEQPTPQNVQTVLVFFVRVSRIVASASDTAMMPLYPGSTSFTKSIIGCRIFSGMPVMKPASPSIDVSINALHGQAVTHWPQLTQEESLILAPPSHRTIGRSRDQSIVSVSLTCRFWQTSTHWPQAIHWFGSYR